MCWVFVSVLGLSLVAAIGGHSSSRCAGLSLSRALLLRSTGSRHTGSVVVAHGPSCSAACGIFPDQGSNPCPLHWQADSQPLRHQGSPLFLLEWALVVVAFKKIHPMYLSCSIYRHKVVHNISLIILLISVESVVIVPQWFLILVMCVFSLFSSAVWIHLINFNDLKEPAFISLIFSVCFLFVCFISHWFLL